MKVAVGTTGSKHLAASHSTDIFVGLGVRACGSGAVSGQPHSRQRTQNAAGNCED